MPGIAYRLAAVLAIVNPAVGAAQALECTGWQQAHPEWVWCDDFESDAALSSSYFEVNRSTGQFGVSTESPYGGTGSLRAVYLQGVAEAGNVKLGLGRSPVASQIATNRDFDDLYWRLYTSTAANWSGNAQKLTRATIFSASNRSQAAIGHLWEDSATGLGLGLDPASGVVGSTVVTNGYNDFANLRWLGKHNGATQIYTPQNIQRWFCVEVHMKLNTPGQSDGVFEYWLDDALEAQATNLNWRGSYTAYGINAIMVENYHNGGFAQTQTRYIDNFVVSTARIGCGSPPVRPSPPSNLTAN